MLTLTHPYLPTCDDCCTWIYDSETWQRQGDGDEWRRSKDEPPPCWKCPKIPKGAEACPDVGRQTELSDKNWQAYMHYKRCQAVLRFPDDEIVERHAGLIRMAEDAAARTTNEAPIASMAMALTMLAKRR